MHKRAWQICHGPRGGSGNNVSHIPHPPAVEGDLVAAEVQVAVREDIGELRQQRRHRRIGAVELMIERHAQSREASGNEQSAQMRLPSEDH